MSLEIQDTTRAKRRLTGVIWGLAKCGKTTFLTSLPGKKLFIMLDPDGDASLPARDDIHILRLFEQPDDVIVRYTTEKLPTMLRKNEQGFQSVIFDSLTTYGTVVLNEAIKNNIGAGKEFKPSLDTPGLAAYGSRTARITDAVQKILKATGAVGVNCWFTSHEDEPKTNEKGDYLGSTLTLSGKAINQVGLNVSEIWHMSVNKNAWRLMISPNRGKAPMGSRMFDLSGHTEFQLKFNPDLPLDQPHSLAKWITDWETGGYQKLKVPIY